MDLNHPCSQGQIPLGDHFADMLLDLICQDLVQDLCINVHQEYRSIIFFFILSFPAMCIKVLLASQNVFGSA